MHRITRSALAAVCLGVVGALAASSAPTGAQTPSSQTQGQTQALSSTITARQIAYLRASNADARDHFGCGGGFDGHAGWGMAMSGDGNTLVVGAPHESSGASGINGNQGDNEVHAAGAAYVYVRNGATWVQQAYLKPSNSQMSGEFGHGVAISGDGNTIAVSAFWEASQATGVNGDQKDESIPQAGAVYVFSRRGNAWTQQAYVKASNTGEAGTADTFGDGDQFGGSLALSDDGNTLAVGAHSEDSAGYDNQRDNSQSSAGAVYVYNRTGAAWQQTAFVKAGNTDGGDMFGYSVSLSADGRTLAVGAFDEDGSAQEINGPVNNARGGAGAVYVFVKGTAGTWIQQGYIHATSTEGGDSFGVAVSISDDGNTLLVGALDEDCPATGVNPAAPCNDDRTTDISTGAAYVFARTGTVWTQQAFLKPHNTGANDWFGSRLVLSGDGNTAIVPAPLEDGPDDKAMEAGVIYVFVRSGTAWRQGAYVKGANTEAYDQFGSSVAVDRDGRTVAVGALGEDGPDNKFEEAGAAYVIGIAAGTTTSSF